MGLRSGRVGGQEQEPGAAGFERLCGLGGRVHFQIVEHDDVAGLQRWGKLGLDVEVESGPVQGAVDQPRRR